MTREEHLNWAKKRALAYLDPGPDYNITGAITSMLSDLSKHEELRNIGAKMSLFGIMFVRTESEVRHFIEGFN